MRELCVSESVNIKVWLAILKEGVQENTNIHHILSLQKVITKLLVDVSFSKLKETSHATM